MVIWEFISVAAMLAVVALAVRLLRTNAVVRMDARTRVRQPKTWLVGVPTFVLLVAVGIPYVDAHVFLASQAMDQDHKDEARRALQKAFAVNPSSQELVYWTQEFAAPGSGATAPSRTDAA